MHTVGVDLAADPGRTGLCEIDWRTLEVTVHERPITDHVILKVLTDADIAGFDVPLGWPDDFVAAVTSHSEQRGWPPAGTDAPADRVPLRFRLTDLDQIAHGSRPLSVSTDRIGVAAMRGARLQAMLASAGVRVDRSGVTGAVVETADRCGSPAPFLMSSLAAFMASCCSRTSDHSWTGARDDVAVAFSPSGDAGEP